MAEYKIQGQTLTAIGDAIRGKVGATVKLTPAQMAQAIEAVQLQEKTVTPSGEMQEVIPDAGYYGLSRVVVNAATGTDLSDAEDTIFGSEDTKLEYGVTNGASASFVMESSSACTVGCAFTPKEAMAIYGVRTPRMYRSDDSTIKLWGSDGNVLKTIEGVTTSTANATEYYFDEPVNLVAGQKYVVSRHHSASAYWSGLTFAVNPKLELNAVWISGNAYPGNNAAPANRFYGYDPIIGPAVGGISRPKEYAIQTATMDALADEVRRISGTSSKMTTAQMISSLKAVQS